jgi:hypothetical protein
MMGQVKRARDIVRDNYFRCKRLACARCKQAHQCVSPYVHAFVNHVFNFLRLLIKPTRRCGYGDQQGYEAFVFLGGFVASQQALLGVLSSRGLNVWWVATIVGVLATATLIGMRLLLVQVKNGKDGAVVAFYDQGSYVFGLWVFWVSLLMSFALIFLTIMELLPWQETVRREYVAPEIPVDVQFIGRKIPTNISPSDSTRLKQEKHMGVWARWLDSAIRAETDGRENRDGEANESEPEYHYAIYVEQEVSFQEEYKTFYARVVAGDDVRIVEKVAFLVHGDYPVFRPVYRQLPFVMASPQKSAGVEESNTFEVALPNPGERVILILHVAVNEPNIYFVDRFAIRIVRE